MGSTENFSLTFNQTQVRSDGAHSNAQSQQPANGSGGGGTVNSVGAGTNVSIGGTATNPVINVPNLAGDVTGPLATNTVALLSGVGSILQTPIAYATGGNVQVRFDLGSYAYIGLTVNASFSPSGSAGIAAGRVQTIDLTNTTGGTLTLTWNASWKLADGALPTSFTAGSSYRIELRCGSTTEGSIIASWFQTGSGITQLTGDVTAGPGSGSQAATIAPGAVTLAKRANLPAYSVMGNNTAGAAAPLALTENQFRTMFFQKQFYVDDYITARTLAADPTPTIDGINDAIADLNTATKGVLVFGPGTYTVNGALTTITASAYVKGCGWYITQLAQGAFDGLTFTSANPCTLRDMWISCGASNQCVVFGNAGTANSGSLVDSIQTTGGLAGISCWNTTNQFTISNCTLGCTHNILVGGYVNAGVVTTGVRSACIIQCNNIGGESTNGIYALHPDGLSIQNNQIVSTTTAINMVFPNQSGRSDLWVVGNHIESGDGLYMNTTNLTGATTSRFNNIVIVGNEFGTSASYGVHTDAHATTSPTSAWPTW